MSVTRKSPYVAPTTPSTATEPAAPPAGTERQPAVELPADQQLPSPWTPKGFGMRMVESKLHEAVSKNGANAASQLRLHNTIIPLLDFDVFARGEVQVGKPGTKGYTEIVASDARRSNHAAKTGEVWIAAEGEVHGTVGAELGGYLPIGPSIGMTRDFKASFIAAYPPPPGAEKDNRSARQFAKDAINAITIPDNAQSFKDMKWAPGSELVLETTKKNHEGVDLMGPAFVASPVFVQPFAGVRQDHDAIYTKHYKQIGDERGRNKYFMQLGQMKSEATDYHAGIVMGPSFEKTKQTTTTETQPVTTKQIPGRVVDEGAVVAPATSAPKAAMASSPQKMVAGEVRPRPTLTPIGERPIVGKPVAPELPTVPTTTTYEQVTKTRLDKSNINVGIARVSGGLTKGETHDVLADAIFDLDTPEGEKHFNELNAMPVPKAAEWIKANQGKLTGGAVAVVDGKTSTIHGEAAILGQSLISVSNTDGKKNAIVWKQNEGETKLAEKMKGVSRQGFLYRLTNEGRIPRAFLDGTERTVEVAAGTIERPSKTATKALQVSLDVTDAKLLREESQEWMNFAAGMGSSLELPNDKNLGKAQIGVSAAFDDDQVKKLIAMAKENPDTVMTAIGNAHAQISGAGIPPWVENRTMFEAWEKEVERAGHSDRMNDQGRNMALAYAEKYPGRDFETDKTAFHTADMITKSLKEMSGADVDAFSTLLDAIGKQYSRDVRLAMLGLKNMSGGYLTRLNVSAKGVNIAKAPFAAPQERLNVEVGRLMAPPEPDRAPQVAAEPTAGTPELHNE